MHTRVCCQNVTVLVLIGCMKPYKHVDYLRSGFHDLHRSLNWPVKETDMHGLWMVYLSL